MLPWVYPKKEGYQTLQYFACEQQPAVAPSLSPVICEAGGIPSQNASLVVLVTVPAAAE